MTVKIDGREVSWGHDSTQREVLTVVNELRKERLQIATHVPRSWQEQAPSLAPQDEAIIFALDLAATDPDARRIIHPRSEIFDRLCTAEASILGEDVETVQRRRAAMIPLGPRRYMSWDEWVQVRAGQIAHEGKLGVCWPGREGGFHGMGEGAGI